MVQFSSYFPVFSHTVATSYWSHAPNRSRWSRRPLRGSTFSIVSWRVPGFWTSESGFLNQNSSFSFWDLVNASKEFMTWKFKLRWADLVFGMRNVTQIAASHVKPKVIHVQISKQPGGFDWNLPLIHGSAKYCAAFSGLLTPYGAKRITRVHQTFDSLTFVGVCSLKVHCPRCKMFVSFAEARWVSSNVEKMEY